MPFSNPLSLSPDGGTTTHDFVEIKRLVDGVERLNDETDLILPEKVVIKHATQGGKGKELDRHLVQITKTERDATTGDIWAAGVNLTLVVPRQTMFSAADVKRLVALMKDFLSDANVEKLLRGEA